MVSDQFSFSCPSFNSLILELPSEGFPQVSCVSNPIWLSTSQRTQTALGAALLSDICFKRDLREPALRQPKKSVFTSGCKPGGRHQGVPSCAGCWQQLISRNGLARAPLPQQMCMSSAWHEICQLPQAVVRARTLESDRLRVQILDLPLTSCVTSSPGTTGIVILIRILR